MKIFSMHASRVFLALCLNNSSSDLRQPALVRDGSNPGGDLGLLHCREPRVA